MNFPQHVAGSWKRARKNYSVLYRKNPRHCFELIKEIHSWFDEFYNKKGADYNYTIFRFKHREQRHHLDGIQECVVTFSRKYGFEYSDLILTEAARHVQDDMGLIPQKEEYCEDFWSIWYRKNMLEKD
ncbi:hypothetical protein KA107_00980 [Candidatus Pacearchaeota archaeon]|nr:hypothetical protein [Candidatus Pacearchaeota archaeon]